MLIDTYEADRQWLIENGFTTIDHEAFCDRVCREMEENNTYDCVEVVRNQVLVCMLLEQVEG